MHAMPAACVRTIQYFMCALGFFPPPEKSKAELSLGLVLKSSGGMINDWILHRCLPSQLKGGFFSESVIRFSKSPKKNIPKNYPELEIYCYWREI